MARIPHARSQPHTDTPRRRIVAVKLDDATATRLEHLCRAKQLSRSALLANLLARELETTRHDR